MDRGQSERKSSRGRGYRALEQLCIQINSLSAARGPCGARLGRAAAEVHCSCVVAHSLRFGLAQAAALFGSFTSTTFRSPSRGYLVRSPITTSAFITVIVCGTMLDSFVPLGQDHRFPVGTWGRVSQILREEFSTAEIEWESAPLAELKTLKAVHDSEYVSSLFLPAVLLNLALRSYVDRFLAGALVL